MSSLHRGNVPETTLVGREREFDIVENAFADAKRNGVPAIARITGESGIGKTFFLSRLARDLESRGWFVVYTACHTIQQHTPRLVANRIVADAIGWLGSEASRYTSGLEDGLASFGVAVARAMGSAPSTQPVDADSYAFTFLRLFEGIAIDHDVAILCDDAQWVDEESTRALLALPQKVSTGCISIAVSERSDEVTPRRKWFPSVDVTLEQLGIEDSLRLVAAELPDLDTKTAEMLAHHANGSPIQLVMLCESVRAGQTSNVERSFRGRTARHLSSLEPDVREFVQLCALLSEPIEQRILLQLYSDPARLEKLIDQSKDYLSVGASGLEFRHTMIAQNVASTIAVPIPLHRRIISALENLSSLALTDYQRIAEHAGACGDRGLEAHAYLRLAKEANAREAAGIVIAASERALSLGAQEARTPDFLLKYVVALRIYDREPEAVDFLMRELSRLSRSFRGGLGRLVSTLITMLVELERVDQATAVYRKYFDLVDSEERPTLGISMKYGALNTANDELFAELEGQLGSLQDRAPNRMLAFNAAVDAGHASISGNAERAREHIACALTYADPDDVRHIHLLEYASMMCDFRHIGLKPLSARLPDINAAVLRVGDIAYGKTCEAWEAFFRGDWDGALDAVREHYRNDMPVSRAAQLLSVAAEVGALTDTDTGLSKEIETTCFAALERGYRQSAMQLLPWWLIGHTDAALDKFALEIASDISIRPPPFSVLGYFPAGFVLWAIKRSQTDVLRSIAPLQGTHDRSNWSRAHWSLTRGLALQALKRSDANTLLVEAAESFRALSAPFFAAFAANHAGTLRADEKTLLTRLGLCRSKTAATKRSATDLTPREWEVARLVGGGASNRQVAESLFVSERTVEVHLGNIFGKLNLSSRAQLVRWLFESQVANPTSR